MQGIQGYHDKLGSSPHKSREKTVRTAWLYMKVIQTISFFFYPLTMSSQFYNTWYHIDLLKTFTSDESKCVVCNVFKGGGSGQKETLFTANPPFTVVSHPFPLFFFPFFFQPPCLLRAKSS